MRVLGGRGKVRVRLDEIEAELLRAMFTDLADVVEHDAFAEGDPVRERLFPAGYRDDVAASDDFRELTEGSLRVERSQRARACADDIDGPGEVVLDAGTGQRWIQALNDLRLALGTRLHVTEDTEDSVTEDSDTELPEPDGSAQAQEWAVYHWLTALQDSIVRRLMRL